MSGEMKRQIIFPTKKEMQLGRWALTPDHDLKLSFRRSKNEPFRENITLRGSIISVSSGELVFAAHGTTDEGAPFARLVTLEGRWKADERNRLLFLVKKGDREEPLALEGAWEIGEHHTLLYRYQKKEPVLLSFRGAWEIREKDRLTYALDLGGKSRFDFRAAVQSPTLLAKKGEIRYQAGIRLAGHTTVLREIVLFGKWKLSRDFSLSFEMEYEKGRRQALFFNTAYRLNEKEELIFSLKDQRKRGLGVEVTFTRSFFEGEGKTFLRLYRDAVESRIEGGIRVPF